MMDGNSESEEQSVENSTNGYSNGKVASSHNGEKIDSTEETVDGTK